LSGDTATQLCLSLDHIRPRLHYATDGKLIRGFLSIPPGLISTSKS
jgi:hypothetical protein